MEQPDRNHIEALLTTHRRRLQFLEVQQAQRGGTTDPSVQMEIEDIEQQIAALEKQLRLASATVAEMFSFEGARPPLPASQRFDWATHYAPVPAPELWQSVLLPELRRFRTSIDSSTVVLLHIRAHISAGIAFGYTFRTPMGIVVWVEQVYPDQELQLWRSDQPPARDHMLHHVPAIIDPAAGDTLIELSISNDIHAAVDTWLQQSQAAIHKRITITPRMGPRTDAVRDGAQAIAMVEYIKDRIKAECAARPGRTTHILASAPIGMAVLLGTRLNACGRIQCYDYRSAENAYYAACLLTP